MKNSLLFLLLLSISNSVVAGGNNTTAENSQTSCSRLNDNGIEYPGKTRSGIVYNNPKNNKAAVKAAERLNREARKKRQEAFVSKK